MKARERERREKGEGHGDRKEIEGGREGGGTSTSTVYDEEELGRGGEVGV